MVREPRHLPLSRLRGATPAKVMVLTDTGFGSVEFIRGVRKLRHHLIVGVRYDHLLSNGRSVCALHKAGSQVQLKDLNLTATVAWFYLKRGGKWQKRYVLSTRVLKASTITWWGKQRWQIEGWFKTAKHRFGLHRFGQQTLQGMYRWLIFSLTAYLLAHWAYLPSEFSAPFMDWTNAAESTLHLLLPQLIALCLLLEVSRLESLLTSQGFEIHISRCKI